MFAKNDARSVEEYLEKVPEDRKKDVDFLHDFIQKAVPALKPHYATNMIGYGSFKYLDSKKQIREWPIISLANQKNYISIYVCGITGEEYISKKFEKELGKVSVGNNCIKIKKIEDVNLDTLKMVLKTCEENPGVLGATLVKE